MIKPEWLQDPRINPEVDFELHEQTLIEDVVALSIKLAAYGEANALMRSELTRQEENLKSLYARISVEVRKMNDGGKKLTEDGIKAVIAAHPDYLEALDRIHVARERSFLADAWWRAIVKISDLAIMMGYGRNAEMRRM